MIAWGVDFGNPEYTADDYEIDGYEADTLFPVVFGFREPRPQAIGLLDKAARQEWRDSVLKPWEERANAAVPLEFRHYGYELSGTALVLRRSVTEVTCNTTEVEPNTLLRPSGADIAAFAKCWQYFEWDWPMDIRLLLMASYG